MKKLLLVCAIVLGVSAMSHAQGRPQRSPEESTAALKTSLTLTADQEAKVLAIYKAQAASRDSLTKAGGDMRTGGQAIRTATNAKIKAILTPDQATKFDASQQRGRGGNGGMGGGGTPPPPTR